MSNDYRAALAAIFGPAHGWHSLCTVTGETFHSIGFYETAESMMDRVDGARNLWFGVHPMADKPVEGRGNRDDVASVSVLQADLDWEHDGAHANPEPPEAKVRERLHRLVLQPRITNNSGHGLQCYWTLDEAVSPGEGLGLQHALDAQLEELGLHNQRSDLASVMRVPGSTNWKIPTEPVTVVVEEHNPRRIKLDLARKRLGVQLGAVHLVSKSSGGVAVRGVDDVVAQLRADDRDADADAVEVLCRDHGGHHPVVHRGGEVYVTRPGKSGGTSASVGYVNPGVVHIFADESWSPFKANENYILSGEMPEFFDVKVRDLFGASARSVNDRHAPIEGVEPAVDEAESDESNSWVDVDIFAAYDGELGTPSGTVLTRFDGKSVLAPGVNAMFGASGDGKTWVALFAAWQCIAQQRHVIWITYEDSHLGLYGERLRQLGVARDDLAYLHVKTPSDGMADAAELIAREVRSLNAELLVLDSIGEAQAVDGIDENADSSWGPWARKVMREVVDFAMSPTWSGAEGTKPNDELVYLSIDHSTKAADGSLFPSGTKRKRAMPTGIMLQVNVREPFARGQVGRVQLICAKDRLGRWRRGEITAEVTMDATTEPYHVRIDAPPEGAEMSQAKRRTAEKRIEQVLRDSAVDLTTSEVIRLVNDPNTMIPGETKLADGTVKNALTRLLDKPDVKRHTRVLEGNRGYIHTYGSNTRHESDGDGSE